MLTAKRAILEVFDIVAIGDWCIGAEKAEQQRACENRQSEYDNGANSEAIKKPLG